MNYSRKTEMDYINLNDGNEITQVCEPIAEYCRLTRPHFKQSDSMILEWLNFLPVWEASASGLNEHLKDSRQYGTTNGNLPRKDRMLLLCIAAVLG